MKKKTSRKRHLFLTKNLILMLVLLALIVMAISAWFTKHAIADASGIKVKAFSSEIDIAESIKTYNSDGTINTDGPGVFKDSITLSARSLTKDCTGDGETLIVPNFNVTNDYEDVRKYSGKDVNTNASGDLAVSNIQSEREHEANPDRDAPEYQYLQYEFYVRSKNPELLLKPECQLLGKTEKDGRDLFSTQNLGAKKSEYGNFNTDAIVGAMRIALIGEGCTSVNQNWQTAEETNTIVSTNTVRGDSVKQLLWVPRPDIKLNIPEYPKGDISNWSISAVTTGDTFSNTYYAYKDAQDHNKGIELITESNPNNDATGKTHVSNLRDSQNRPILGKQINVTDFSYSRPTIELYSDYQKTLDDSNKDYYYVTKYTLRIWIEGSDSEARRAMDGGEFYLQLLFM